MAVPWSKHVPPEQGGADNETEGADDNVGDAQERVLAAKPRRVGRHQHLLALEARHREVVLDLELRTE